MLFSLFLVCSCGKAEFRGLIPEGTAQNPMTMEEFKLIETKGGIIRTKVMSDFAVVESDTKKMRGKKITVLSYNPDGKFVSRLTSDTGIVYTDNNNMEAIGNVVLTGTNNTRLETAKLTWFFNTNRIFSDVPVVIYKGNNIMRGIGLEADVRMEDVSLKKVFTTVSNLNQLQEKKGKTKQ